MRFAGKVAVITGGGRGIGAATAVRLASEGAAVAIGDVDHEAAQQVAVDIATRGGKALPVQCDVTDPHSVNLLMELAQELGELAFVVCCAGIIRIDSIHKLQVDDWDAVIGTHLKGSFLVAQAAQKQMVKARFGRIIFLSSIAVRGLRGQANYATAKAGITGLTRTLALELGRFGINVNAVAPGFIDTRLIQLGAERSGVDYETFKRQASASVPLGRIGQPEEVAGVIAFLCSTDAAFVTGQTIFVTGAP